MGALWNGVLQALLIGLAIQMIASALCVICACLWESIKEWMPRRSCAGGEPIAESDLEMGTVNGSEGIDHQSSTLATNGSVEDFDDALHEGKPERSEDVAGFPNGTVVLSECCNTSFSAAVVADSAPLQQDINLDGTTSLS